MKTFLSVSIDSSSMSIAEGSFIKGSLALKKAQSFELPGGCIKTNGAADELLLADALQNAVKAGGFSSKGVILTIGNKRAFIKELDLPAAKPREIEGMIRSELHQTFNVPKTDIVQYKTIASYTNDKAERFNSYRVASLDRDIVLSYYNAIEHARLKPGAMDIDLNAIDKLSSFAGFVNGKALGEDSVALIDFGYITSTVYIIARGLPLFYRFLDFGAKEVWHLAGQGVYPGGDLGSETETPAEFSLFDGKEIREVYKNGLKPFFYKFNDEIQKTMTFYNSRYKNINVGSAYVFGAGSRIPEIAEYWSSNLGVPVELLTSVGGSNTAEHSLDPLCINAAGALIRYQ